MQEVRIHESRCLRRRQCSLIFISSTLSCVLGSGPDTIHLTQHSSPLNCSFLFVVFVIFFVLFLFSMLSLKLCRCYPDIVLSSGPRTGLVTT